jgi:HAD superfamily hydrolase (TIGR01484 family)
MKPLVDLPSQAISSVLFDIDDTLTTQGRLTAAAYAALERLRDAGKRVVCVTGRPAGWCDHIGRMWPVDAVVGENGAFYFYFADGKLNKRFYDDAATRARKRAKLEAIARRIMIEVPGSALAADQAYRETDLAIDYCEDVPPLSLQAAGRIASLMREEGLTARVSSIHVNGWFGDYDKLAMTRALFAERFAEDIGRANASVVFVGDSPNDAPMFGYFDRSVGVANVRRYGALLAASPKYVTPSESGTGFAELVAHLLDRA